VIFIFFYIFYENKISLKTIFEPIMLKHKKIKKIKGVEKVDNMTLLIKRIQVQFFLESHI